jgi:hypothetical protein
MVKKLDDVLSALPVQRQNKIIARAVKLAVTRNLSRGSRRLLTNSKIN